MDTAFISVLQKLVAEQGKNALFDPAKGKSLLADYTRGEYKKESRLLLQALEAGVPKAIATTGELDLCKKQQVKLLQEDHFLSEEAAADVVDTLALVLRGQEKPKKRCKSCGKELQDEWKTCPYCSASTEGRETPPAASRSDAPNAAKRREASVNKPSAAEDCFSRGMTFFKRGDFNTAIAEFTEALRLDPNSAYTYVFRGSAYGWMGNHDQAMADLTQAIRLDPNNAEAYKLRGDAYGWKGNLDQAITDLTQAIRLDPNYAEAYASRGAAYGGKNDHDRVIIDCTEAIRLDPNSAPAYVSRGNAYGVGKGNFDQAIADFTQAIRLDPNSAQTYVFRGSAYFLKGNNVQARADVNRALQINPNDQMALSLSAELLQQGY